MDATDHIPQPTADAVVQEAPPIWVGRVDIRKACPDLPLVVDEQRPIGYLILDGMNTILELEAVRQPLLVLFTEALSPPNAST